MLRSWISLLLAAVLLGAFASGSVGCASSGKPKSLADEFEAEANPPLSDTNKELARGCLSAVEIHGQRLVTVQETVESVFTAAGLAVFKRNAEEIGFERLATRGERGKFFRLCLGDLQSCGCWLTQHIDLVATDRHSSQYTLSSLLRAILRQLL